MIQLVNNHWLKIVALMIGFLIWLHVATEKTYTFEMSLPVNQTILRGNLVLASALPDSLLISVSGTGKQLLRRSWRQSGIRINAGQFGRGHYRLDLSRSNISLTVPQSVILEDVISPVQLQLEIDTTSTADVPVLVNINVTADEGFAIVPTMKTDPATILVIGPRSKMSEIKEIITGSILLSGLRNNVEVTLPLVLPDIYGFTIIPESVKVTINVVPVRTRVFENLPVIIFNLPPSQTATPDPATVRVELSGPPEEVSKLNSNAITASVDFREIDSAGVGLLRVDCPSHISVKKTSTNTVIVRVKSNADSGN